MTSIGVALALMSSPALASASAVAAPAQTISPMVALSIFGSQASATALCGTSSTTVAASAAASAQAPAGGCVLPLVDAPPPVPVAEPLPVAQPIAASSGFGITPILLGLAGIAILAALIAGSSDKNDNDPPVSVN
jgi:hypothetical protein